jgi:hypothetical protein
LSSVPPEPVRRSRSSVIGFSFPLDSRPSIAT